MAKQLTQTQKDLEARLERIVLGQAPANIPIKEARVWARGSARILRETLELHVQWLTNTSSEALRAAERQEDKTDEIRSVIRC